MSHVEAIRTIRKYSRTDGLCGFAKGMLRTSLSRYNPAMTQSSKPRRDFLRGALAAGGIGAAQIAQAQPRPAAAEFDFLPKYARAQNYKSLKQSSYDRTGGNRDSWNI